MKLHLAFLPIALLSACDWFDPALYLNAQDAGGLGSTTADDCENAPVVAVEPGSGTTFSVTTAGHTDSINETCENLTVAALDAFFAVETQAGEKWHFHVRGQGTEPTADPAVHVRQRIATSCGDPRQCTVGVDACETTNEHVTFVPSVSGTYVIGIDSRYAGSGSYQVEVYRPECGDGVPTHSEPCDQDADCDQCRWIISSEERETNDDVTAANVMSGSTAQGQLAGCDDDWFVVDVAAGTTQLQVDVIDAADSCEVPWTTRLLSPTGSEVASGGPCDDLTVSDPAEGEWSLVIQPSETLDRAYEYEITIDLSMP